MQNCTNAHVRKILLSILIRSHIYNDITMINRAKKICKAIRLNIGSSGWVARGFEERGFGLIKGRNSALGLNGIWDAFGLQYLIVGLSVDRPFNIFAIVHFPKAKTFF